MRILGFCWGRPYAIELRQVKTSRFVTFAARGRPRGPKTSRFVTFASGHPPAGCVAGLGRSAAVEPHGPLPRRVSCGTSVRAVDAQAS